MTDATPAPTWKSFEVGSNDTGFEGIQPADERTALTERLDRYRGIVVTALADLTWMQASTRSLPATDLTPAGIVRHLAWAEDRWFQGRLLGLPMPAPWDESGMDDPDAAIRLQPHDDLDSILQLYSKACDRSRRAVADTPTLDALAQVPSFGVGPVNLRWILVHMIDETARHAGHLDLLLDAIRGADRKVAFHRTLPSKRVGAGAVIRNADGDVLIVKPTYKDGWEMPGGAVEANESPAAGCARELREELGLDLPLGAMLCVDYNPTTEDYLESVMFLFDAGTIDQQTIDTIHIDPIEIAEYRFVSLDEAEQMLARRVGRRLRAAVATPGATSGYLEDQLDSLSTRSMFHSAGDPGDGSDHALVYSEAELYEAAFGYRDYGKEWSFLESLWNTFGWSVPSPHVVEIAAGPAGHALVAARAGWTSHALDTSAAMVELGRTRAREFGVALDYSQQDMRTFSIQARCHLAVTMLDSISYLTSNDDALSHLSAVRDALVPGGLYIIEMDHPTAVFGFDRTTESSWTVNFRGSELRVEWVAEADSFDPVTQCSRMRASFELWSGGTRERVVRETAWQRSFTLQEIDALAKASGTFEIVGVFGGFDLDLGLADDGAWRTVVAMRRIA